MLPLYISSVLKANHSIVGLVLASYAIVAPNRRGAANSTAFIGHGPGDGAGDDPGRCDLPEILHLGSVSLLLRFFCHWVDAIHETYPETLPESPHLACVNPPIVNRIAINTRYFYFFFLKKLT